MKNKWPIVLAAILTLTSLLFYVLSIILFHEPRETVFLMPQDLAFVPVNVLLVSIVLDRLLASRDKNELMVKLNMVIGIFFGEVGSGLIRQFSGFTENFDLLRDEFQVDGQWDEKKYSRMIKTAGALPIQTDSRIGNMRQLKDFLMENRSFPLTLMENPNLLENEKFTQLLWAVFHVTDEMSYRTDLDHLSKPDLDIRRAYGLLLTEWLIYMNHLRKSYPYLYSLALRMNPFNPGASPEIKFQAVK